MAGKQLTFGHLRLRYLPQLVHLRRRACDRSFHHLCSPAHKRALRDRIRGRPRVHLDDPNARIVGPTIMLAIP